MAKQWLRQTAPKLAALVAFLCLFAGRSAAEVRYRYPTAACTTKTVRGESTVCCSGDCLDGTTVWNQSGMCRNFFDECLDPVTPMSCSSNQVFTLTHEEAVDAGLGLCYIPITGCRWYYGTYTYSCCDCPAGFKPVASACPDRQKLSSDRCVGCSQPDEQLQFDSSIHDYVCKGPSLACRAARAVATAASALSLLNTWASSLCATTDLSSLVVSLLQSAEAVVAAIKQPSDGVLGTKFNAASAVISTIQSFALGAAIIAGAEVEVPLAVALPLVYKTACDVVAKTGVGLTIGGGIADIVANLSCPAPPPKRSVSPEFELDVDAVRALARRDGLSNPCAEFVASFPVDSSSIAATDSACNDIESYDVGSITDSTIASAVSTLQQVCTSLQDSSQTAFMMDLVNLLSALEAIIPYCDVGTSSSSSTDPSSLPSATSETSSSTLPSSSADPSSLPSATSETSSSMPPSSSADPSSLPSASSGAASSTPPSSSADPSTSAPSSSGDPSDESATDSNAASASSASQSDGAPQSSPSQDLSSTADASSSTTWGATSTASSRTPSRTGGCHPKNQRKRRQQF